MFSKQLCVFFVIVAGFILCESASVPFVPIPVSCGPNQTFHNQRHCDVTCVTYSGPQPDNKNCVPGCRCVEGYVRDGQATNVVFPSAKCIKQEDCNVSK